MSNFSNLTIVSFWYIDFGNKKFEGANLVRTYLCSFGVNYYCSNEVYLNFRPWTNMNSNNNDFSIKTRVEFLNLNCFQFCNFLIRNQSNLLFSHHTSNFFFHTSQKLWVIKMVSSVSENARVNTIYIYYSSVLCGLLRIVWNWDLNLDS